MTRKTCSFLLILLLATPVSARSIAPAGDAVSDLKRCEQIRKEAIKHDDRHLMKEYTACMNRILRGEPVFPSGPVQLPSDDE
nr:hypothetical protein [uncultured Cohaesibacter sp.]